MNMHEDCYISALKTACNEIHLDFFPQVEASDYLYHTITLEDIYLPLTLQEASEEAQLFQSEIDDEDIDELIRLIDKKLNAMDKEMSQSKRDDVVIDNKETGSVGSRENNSHERGIGQRILIQANPGSGKTTFCKRLTLALLNNDSSFFERYSKSCNIDFNSFGFPLLINCRSVAGISEDELKTMDFKRLMFFLCSRAFGRYFDTISEETFLSAIGAHENKDLCVILDGWDEIFDTQKAQIFLECINGFIKNHSKVNVLLSIRASYGAPKLVFPYSGRYGIKALSDDDIRTFCDNWCKKILSPTRNSRYDFDSLSDQIINSREQQVKLMMRNPLELSLLLTVSKNEGKLPENKAELFKELVDLYVYWSANKNKGGLSQKSIRIFLAYIATAFTKDKKLSCGETELIQMINQAMTDLEGVFPVKTTLLNAREIMLELSHTGVLTKTYAGNQYSFSESGQVGTHRQMQEYLTAYAILSQYADAEYNNMSPIEILEDKYSDEKWREVITFFVLMNIGILRQDLINNFVGKLNVVEDSYYLTNLLFQFIIDDADIRISDKHKIYDSVFYNSITDKQISNIVTLVNSNNRSSTDFVDYISNMFTASVEKGNYHFGLAYAVIESSKAISEEISPFDRAEVLINSERDVDIVAGTQILAVMALCNCAGIRNEFLTYYSEYKMPARMIDAIKKQIRKRRCIMPIVKCVRDTVVAGFISFQDLFDESTLAKLCANLCKSEDKVVSEIILSITPIFSPLFKKNKKTDDEIKEYYINKLNTEVEHNDYKEIIFTFGICVCINCYPGNKLLTKWRNIIDIYENDKNIDKIAKARYVQLKMSYIFRLLDTPQAGDLVFDDYNSGYWTKIKQSELHMTYVLNESLHSDGRKMRISFPSEGIGQDAVDFFDDSLKNDHTTYNNLAYLLRRKEIKKISISNDTYPQISPELLLISGVKELDEFSIINYALTISGVRINHCGDYETGLTFLKSIRSFIYCEVSFWKPVVDWWFKLAIDRNEFEGLVVLTWLYMLRLIDLRDLDYRRLKVLARKIKKHCSNNEDFEKFLNYVENIIN